MKDNLFVCCTDCGVEFAWNLRKHHCRVCGQVFCHHCTSKRVAGSALPGVYVCVHARFSFLATERPHTGNRFKTRAPERCCNICYDGLIKQVDGTTTSANVNGMSEASCRSRRANVLWDDPMNPGVISLPY